MTAPYESTRTMPNGVVRHGSAAFCAWVGTIDTFVSHRRACPACAGCKDPAHHNHQEA